MPFCVPQKRKQSQVDMASSPRHAAPEGDNAQDASVAPTSFAGPLTKFTIGPSKVVYEVHTNVVLPLLRRPVQFQGMPCALDTCQPETFDAFLHWAYASFHGFRSQSPRILEALSGAQLLDLYIFGDVMDCKRLMNAVTTCIFFRARKSNTPWYALGFTKQAFEHFQTSRGLFSSFSQLETLLLHLFIHGASFHGQSAPSEEALDMIPAHLQRAEIWTALDGYNHQWSKDPDQAKCLYHQHKKDEACNDGWSLEHNMD